MPFARFASDKVVENIEKFIDRGGAVILLGPDSLTLDPWGRKRNGLRLEGPNVHRIKGYQSSEEQEAKPGGKADDAGKYYLYEFMKVVEEVVPSAEVGIVGEDGLPSWGVETRTVLLGADRLVYAVNVSPDPIRVSLLVDGGSAVWIRGTEFKTSTDLPPLHPVLIRVGPGSDSDK